MDEEDETKKRKNENVDPLVYIKHEKICLRCDKKFTIRMATMDDHKMRRICSSCRDKNKRYGIDVTGIGDH